MTITSHSNSSGVSIVSIESDAPVRARQVGQGGKGIDWTVQPENFDNLIEAVNASGGLVAWKIEAAA